MAATIGAKVSTSGHMTSTSRGSRVGSSASRPRIDLAEHLDLAGAAVAGVHLDAAVARVERRRLGWTRSSARSCLSRPSRVLGAGGRRRAGRRRVRARSGRGAAAARGRRATARSAAGCASRWRAGVVAAAGGAVLAGDGVPERGGGVVQPQVHVAVLGERGEDAQPGGGQAAGAEDGEPFGQRAQVGSARSVAQASSSSSAGDGVADAVAEPAPQLGLPAQVVVQRRAVAPLVVAGRPRRAASPAATGRTRRTGAPGRLATASRRPLSSVGGAEVLGQRPAPRLARDGRVDDLEQRPERLAGAPTARRPRRAPATRPAPPRRAACSARGTPRWRRRRRRPPPRGRATAAAPATARRPWPARPRSRWRTGRPAERPGRPRGRGPAPRRRRTCERRAPLRGVLPRDWQAWRDATARTPHASRGRRSSTAVRETARGACRT